MWAPWFREMKFPATPPLSAVDIRSQSGCDEKVILQFIVISMWKLHA